jgi:hypothetical protein
LKHNIEFTTYSKNFETKEDAIDWMLDAQLSRRNVNPMQRIVFADKKRENFERRAKANMSAGGGDKIAGLPNLVNPVSDDMKMDTTKKLSEIAGVGKETYRMGAKILQSNNEEVKQKVLSGEMSINAVYRYVLAPLTPFFLAKDATEWIGHSNISKMLSIIDKEDKFKTQLSTLTNGYCA